VHVVPGENGLWIVVDFQRRPVGFRSKAAVLEGVKHFV